ncbi:MAG: helix-turn-helix transcriptional regulator [Labilithrix sp.]|nr:helix-turn-helix transcriptional regulator [Labilithrix sp.]
MSRLGASPASCHPFKLDASPRRHTAARQLRPIVDALHGGAGDYDAWCASVVSAATDAFGGGQARLELFQRSLDVGNDGPSEELRFVGQPDGSSTVVLSVRCSRAACLGAREHSLFEEITLHLENSVRLRRHGDRTLGLLLPDGELLDRDFAGFAPRCPMASVEGLWRELVEGRATVAKAPARTPFYVVLESPPTWRHRRALSETEARVATLAALGQTGKALASSLGLSASTVCRALRSAASKIGLRTTSELVRLAAGLAIEQPTHIDGASLTLAERDVATLVRAGLSNQAIAQIRGRSLRTIANQVASILRKTACPSRRALAAMRLRYSPSDRIQSGNRGDHALGDLVR